MNSVQLILSEKFLDLKNKNQQLSHRYFAKKIGLSSGALSEILQGKRKISLKLAQKIADRLCLNPKEKAHFLGLNEEQIEPQGLDYTDLKNDQFQMISDWHHFAILNLVKSDYCVHKADWFARQLNLPLKTVTEALRRLLRLELLKIKGNKFVRTASRLTTSDGIRNLSIIKSNTADLQMIQSQINVIDVQQRDLTSITLLIDEEKMKDYKKWIRGIQDKFANKFQTTKSKTVFRLSIALFPLRKTD